MCDDARADEFDAALARKGMTRRSFAAMSTSAALAACAGTGGRKVAADDLTERPVTIQMGESIADGFFVHPAGGRHPGVIMWPDIAGLREAKKVMARRLAQAGFAVLVVNPYYRSSPAPVMESFAEFMEPAGRTRVMGYRALLTPQAIMNDARAFTTFLDASDAVDTAKGIGSCGYCMGGPFTVFSAAAVPSRVRAAASFHGGGLVGDGPDAPVNLLARTQARFLFAIAQNDDAKAPGDKDALGKAAAAAGRSAEVVVYPADHGWCVPDSPVYDAVQADLAFEQMTGLFLGL
jgi:carboxymethylenebutenolidase